MIQFFKKWFILLTLAGIAFAGLCLTVGGGSLLASVILGLISPLVIYIFVDDYRKRQESQRAQQKLQLCARPYDEIIFFIFDLAGTYTFGTDIEPPKNISDLYGGWNIFPDRPGFEMRIRFLTVGRVPIDAKDWGKKEEIFQTDFNWGITNGNLTGTINVKRFYYSDNAAWLDLEVIP